jgi:cysteine synthase A
MPRGVSSERVLMIRSYGGEICFTSAEGGIREAIAETELLAKQHGAFLPRQFTNPDNAEAHRLGTAREILEQVPGGNVDGVVSGVGTGGTLVGLYQAFRQFGCPVRPFLARPVELGSPMEPECCSFSGKIPGVVDCMSTIFQEAALPDLITLEVEERNAIETTRALIRMGFPAGPSSGLNYRAAVMAAQLLGEHATVVTVFPDRMERYFSTELFQPFCF